MAELVLTAEGAPATPSSGSTTLWVSGRAQGPSRNADTTSAGHYETATTDGGAVLPQVTHLVLTSAAAHPRPIRMAEINDTGVPVLLTPESNIAMTNQTVAGNSNVNVNGAQVFIPSHGVHAGLSIRWRFAQISKTAAGVATPIIQIRYGPFGGTSPVSDSTVATLTFAAQTGATDTGNLEVYFILRATGSNAAFVAGGILEHQNTTTGLANQAVQVVQTSGTIDTTANPLIFTLFMNSGTSGSWTLNNPHSCTVMGLNI